jgi:hypothetical protein
MTRWSVTLPSSLPSSPESAHDARPSQSGAIAAASAREPQVPKDASQFLFDLAVSLHKYAMYPAGHPALLPALQGLAQRAAALLTARERFSIGVTPDRLVIEGVATDARQPMLRGLADRLHRHHLAAISFERGITVPELADLVAAIAEDPDRGRGPLGTASQELLAAWPHVGVHTLTLDGLEIVDQAAPDGGLPGGAETAGLWAGLARAALERGGQPARAELALDPGVVARAIDEHQKADAYDQVIVGYLLQIADQLRGANGPEAWELRRRTSLLVSAMQPETLKRLLDMGGDALQRARFMRDATTGMAAGAVVDLVQAAAEASSETVSSGLVRLFSKLAAHAEGGSETIRPLADNALRDQVQRLIGDWKLADPLPVDYRVMLQEVSRALPEGTPALSGAVPLDDALRLVQMSIELDEESSGFWQALDQLVAAHRLSAIVDILSRSADTPLATRVWTHLLTPSFVQSLLDGHEPDVDGVECLLPFLPGAALAPLLDLLVNSTDRHVRRTAFDQLRRVGEVVVPLALERLQDDRWYVARNILSLLAHLDRLPADFDASRWLGHQDARVRREALRVALRTNWRDRAILEALTDDDERVLAAALHATMEHSPAHATSRLLALADSATLPDPVRALAVKALARIAHGPDALAVLLRIASGEVRLLVWRTLPPTSDTLLAALSALAARWPDERQVAAVLRRARASADAAVRRAASGDQA